MGFIREQILRFFQMSFAVAYFYTYRKDENILSKNVANKRKNHRETTRQLIELDSSSN